MRITVVVHEIEFQHGVIFPGVVFNTNDLIVDQVALYLFPEALQRICKVDLKGTGIVC